MIEHAIAILNRGWAVFPCQPRSKKPATQHGVNEATRDRAQVEAWWQQNPAFNPAISLRLSGLTVLDADTGLATGDEATAWASRNGLPPTFTVRTGRRDAFGIQFYFNGISRNKPYKHDGVSGEVRSAGYYVMAPGAIHPDSGERYEILNGGEAVSVPPLVSQLSGTRPADAKLTTYPPMSIERVHEAFEDKLVKIRQSFVGGRHYTSYAGAWFAARAFLAGVLPEVETKQRLWEATANLGLPEKKRRQNLYDGWNDGLKFGALSLDLYPGDWEALYKLSGDEKFQRCWDGYTIDFESDEAAKNYMIERLDAVGAENIERILAASSIDDVIRERLLNKIMRDDQ